MKLVTLDATAVRCWVVVAGALIGMQCGGSDDAAGTAGAGPSDGGGGDAAVGGHAGAGGASGKGGQAGGGGSSGSDASAGAGGNGGVGGSAGGATGSGGDSASGGSAGSGGSAASGGSAGSSGIPGPVGVGGSWTLVFNDEFEGSSLDLSKWQPNWFGSTDTALTPPVNSDEVSCYDPAQVVVDGGLLLMTAVSTTKADCKKKDGSAASYASGLIMSRGLYNFTYGAVEARMWLAPGGTSKPENWAAFWVNGEVWPQDGEIDIMETLGGGSSTRWTYHYDSDTGSGVVHSQLTAPKNNLITGSDWHIFGANWQPDKITFYYDGVDVGSVASSDLSGGAKTASTPHYFILNLGLSGSYAVVVPSTLKVDYVRHWQ